MKGTRFISGLALFALLTLTVVTGCNTVVEDDQGSTSQGLNKHDFTGQSQSYGDGSVRAFVNRKGQDVPTSVGIVLSEDALSGLPEDPDPMDPAKHRVLELPQEAGGMLFDHVFLNWNPGGHPPLDHWGAPHFDIHFYMISSSDREGILDFGKLMTLPPAQFIPAGYNSEGPVPQMGLHWYDPTSPEFQPGGIFTSTFLYGSYDGHVIFLEPMITKAFIESVKTAKGKKVTFPIPQPQAFENPGYYPTKYSISYNPGKKEYTIALESFQYRG